MYEIVHLYVYMYVVMVEYYLMMAMTMAMNWRVNIWSFCYSQNPLLTCHLGYLGALENIQVSCSRAQTDLFFQVS